MPSWKLHRWWDVGWEGYDCVEKRKNEGLARVVLPLHCHLPRLGCPFLRHLRQAYRRVSVVASSRVFWEAWLSVECVVFLQLTLWNVKRKLDEAREQ